MKFAGHQNRGMEAIGRVLEPGEGYRERDATTSPPMWPTTAAEIVFATRMRSLSLTLEREADIDAGIEHMTPAEEMHRGMWK